MLFGKLLSLRRTLAFRLAIWYATISALSSLGAFLVLYLAGISLVQRRTDQELLNERVKFSAMLRLHGMDAVKVAASLEAASKGADKTFYRILNRKEETLFESDMSFWGDVGIGRSALKKLSHQPGHLFETLAIPEQRYGLRILYAPIGPRTILQLGLSLKDNAQLIEVFRRVFLITMCGVILVAPLAGGFMARRALLGVGEVTRTARRITKGTLGSRVPVKARGDEIEQLATTFNSMLDRIDTLVKEMREMTDNIAHDLRSPLTRIRGTAEMALTAGRTMNEYEAMATSTIEECDRLLQMINTMLDISETEAGASSLAVEEVDMAHVVRDACDLFQPVAEDKGITLSCETPTHLPMEGDLQKLQRMAANLLDNSLKYTPEGGTVTVLLLGDEEGMTLSVQDTGIGISKTDLPHIFDRFYRCDQSRSQAGIGLGLSLALAIARAHGGGISVSSEPGKGSTFSAILPR
jgi:heavy metal sensor kinase